MKKDLVIYQPDDIEKKNKGLLKNRPDNKEDSGNFRKLIAEVIVEIIIKRQKNGCDRVYKNK